MAEDERKSHRLPMVLLPAMLCNDELYERLAS